MGLFKKKDVFQNSGKGNYKNVKKIIERHGVDPMIDDGDGNRPIHYAAAAGHTGLVGYFIIDKGIDPNLRNNFGLTPLIFAAGYNRFWVVRDLVEKYGVDPDEASESGITPLRAATSSVIYVLKKSEISFSIYDLKYDKRDRNRIAECLIGHGANPYTRGNLMVPTLRKHGLARRDYSMSPCSGPSHVYGIDSKGVDHIKNESQQALESTVGGVLPSELTQIILNFMFYYPPQPNDQKDTEHKSSTYPPEEIDDELLSKLSALYSH